MENRKLKKKKKLYFIDLVLTIQPLSILSIPQNLKINKQKTTPNP